MAVNLSPPVGLLPVGGVLLGSAAAGLRDGGGRGKKRDDLTVITFPPDAAVAGVFTKNRFPAPPVALCRSRLRANIRPRAFAVNASIANAGTLGAGLTDARQCCTLLAKMLDIRAVEVLPFSTGVIMERLPMQKYAEGLHKCVSCLQPNGWLRAAKAMMTTDTVAKAVSRRITDGKRDYSITGIAKGAGMIHPQMATMLAFVATDAAINLPTLRAWQREISADTFNAVSVDGDTSTNDSFMLVATGAAGKPSKSALGKLRAAINEVCAHLAFAIVRDGEGAGRIMTVRVSGGKSFAVCRRVADAVCRSPLVKTALAAADANVGRLLMAIGNAGGGFAANKVMVSIGKMPVIRNGGMDTRYDEKAVANIMRQKEIAVDITINGGSASATLTTCDLTEDYIKINASYRS
ncbi:MAG: bifunctional glutamate N-acetyltransferase/amino-acid acetyltransferase ArgJ [Gammaproteobacteria bacterium]